MKVVVVGSGEMLMSLIAGCEDYGCKIVGVLRAEQHDMSPLRRFIKDRINPSQDLIYVRSHNLPEMKVRSVNCEKFKKQIIKLNADIILVGSWGERFRQDIIDLPKIGTINAHPSLLPKYRGPNPYLEVIRHREKVSGVTFHLMDKNYDGGEILSQKQVEVLEFDTGKELKTRITAVARDGIKELLTDLDNDIIIPIEQNPKLATYYTQISKEDLLLDFTKSTEDVCAHIRALHPWTRAYFAHHTHYLSPNPYKLEVLENEKNLPVGTIYDVDPKYRMVAVVCGDNKVLKMTDVRLFGILRVVSDLYIKLRVKVGKSII